MNEADQIEMFPTELRLLRADGDRNARWIFLLTVQPDLFGGAVLVLEGGQVGFPVKSREFVSWTKRRRSMR